MFWRWKETVLTEDRAQFTRWSFSRIGSVRVFVWKCHFRLGDKHVVPSELSRRMGRVCALKSAYLPAECNAGTAIVLSAGAAKSRRSLHDRTLPVSPLSHPLPPGYSFSFTLFSYFSLSLFPQTLLRSLDPLFLLLLLFFTHSLALVHARPQGRRSREISHKTSTEINMYFVVRGVRNVYTLPISGELIRNKAPSSYSLFNHHHKISFFNSL